MTQTNHKKANVAVLVSGGGTNLQAILDAERAGLITNGRVVLVVSNKENAYALERAKSCGIKTCVIKRQGKDGQDAFEDALSEALLKAKADLIVLAGFMCILSKRFTDRFQGKIINVHPSLIPSFCGEGLYGLHVHEAALAKGVKVTGATVHFVNEIPDGGAIIMQKAVRVHPHDTPERLQARVMRQAEWKILPAAIEQLCATIVSEKKGE